MAAASELAGYRGPLACLALSAITLLAAYLALWAGLGRSLGTGLGMIAIGGVFGAVPAFLGGLGTFFIGIPTAQGLLRLQLASGWTFASAGLVAGMGLALLVVGFNPTSEEPAILAVAALVVLHSVAYSVLGWRALAKRLPKR